MFKRTSSVLACTLVYVITGCASTSILTPPSIIADVTLLEARAATKELRPCISADKVPYSTYLPAPLLPVPLVRSGQVKLVFDIGANGLTKNIEIMYADEETFVDLAISAVKQWKFEPNTSGIETSNVCKSANTIVNDERGRVVATWPEVQKDPEKAAEYEEKLKLLKKK